jgi:predicted nucleic acid-binding protein
MTDYKRVFLDTAPVIYYLQKDTTYFERAKKYFYSLRLAGAAFVSSDITIAEYCVFPYRSGNEALLRALDGFFQAAQIEIIHTSSLIAKEAARIRAEYQGFKAMDSLQLAMATNSGCDLFLTNDKQLQRFKEIKCLMVEDLP